MMSNFRPMRRHRQQLSDKDCISILEHTTSGTLALLGDNDYPYTVPVSFVYHDSRLYFHSAAAGYKVDTIRRHNTALSTHQCPLL